MQKLTRICSNDSFHFWQFIVFSMLYTISTTIDYASVMLSIYAKLSNDLLTMCPRKRVVHARNSIYLSKVENYSYYHQELVSHPMPE